MLVGGCVVVPGPLLAALLAELQAPRQRPPMGVAVPRRSPAIAALVDLVRSGAIEHRQRLRATGESFALATQPPSATESAASARPVGGLSMGEVVSVADVAGMLGCSPQYVRVLARSGALPGARKARGIGNGSGPARTCWRIPAMSVHAYLADRAVA